MKLEEPKQAIFEYLLRSPEEKNIAPVQPHTIQILKERSRHPLIYFIVKYRDQSERDLYALIKVLQKVPQSWEFSGYHLIGMDRDPRHWPNDQPYPSPVPVQLACGFEPSSFYVAGHVSLPEEGMSVFVRDASGFVLEEQVENGAFLLVGSQQAIRPLRVEFFNAEHLLVYQDFR